jgi:malate synthase
MLDEELARIRETPGEQHFDGEHFTQARRLVLEVALADDYAAILDPPGVTGLRRQLSAGRRSG